MPVIPKVFLPIRSNDVTIRPFKAYKNYTLRHTDFDADITSSTGGGFRRHGAHYKRFTPHIFAQTGKGVSDLTYEFNDEDNTNAKTIIKYLSEVNNQMELQTKVNNDFKKLVDEIKENSNIQIITDGKNDQEILELLEELIIDFKEQNNLRKIENLEKKLINNLDENSFSELVKLKSQLNRE